MKTTKFASMIAIIGLSINAVAAQSEDAPAPECDGVKVATGAQGKGYANLYADIKKLCGAKVNLCEVRTSGGLDNLNALSVKDADIGFVQVDTINDMKVSDENIAALQVVAPLNFNYLHVITATNGFVTAGEKKFGLISQQKQVIINRFTDLRGQVVALVGSAALMGRRLNQSLGYNMQFIDAKDDATALDMVKTGKVAAAFTVSGWPSGAIKNLTQQSGLTLVPFDAPVNEPYKVRPLNYKNIAVYNNNSLAVPNVLVTRPFSGSRAASVAAVQQCITSNLNELKEGNYQPAWNEIKTTAETYGLPKFVGSKK